MSRLQRHFFVCTNLRGPESGMPSCADNESQAVLAALRAARIERGLIQEVYVTETTCLGPCPKQGATVVVYPEGVWYTGVTSADVAEIADWHMARGKVVERLRDRNWG
jgi:(2Fe-2S) ferredoxin